MTARSRAMKQMKLQKFVILGFIGLHLQLCLAGNDDFEKCKKDWDKLIPELKHDLDDRLHLDATFNCTPFQNCSGTSCSGTAVRRKFKVSINIEHCLKPVKIGLIIAVPALHINKHIELKNNMDTIVLNGIPLPVVGSFKLPVTISIKPNITKNRENITLKAQIIGSAATPLGPVKKTYDIGDGVTVPVNNKACIPAARPTVRSVGTKNVTSTTTKSVATAASSTKAKQSSLPTRAKPSSSSTKPKPPITTTKLSGRSSTDNGTTAGKQKTEQNITTKPEGNQGKHKQFKRSSPLSTGGKVAISASVILLAVAAVGLLAYWRRLRRRRPSYYNDISINSPTDGVDDDDDDDEAPLFNSKLVL